MSFYSVITDILISFENSGFGFVCVALLIFNTILLFLFELFRGL